MTQKSLIDTPTIQTNNTISNHKLKGVILAGGKGLRLYPLTKVTNKHLLPVGREPMIFNPIRKLIEAGIQEILIITSTEQMGSIVNLLGGGAEFGCHFTYKVQEQAGGIAHALALAEDFAGSSKIVVILGDNIIEKNICSAVESFRAQKEGARILLKEVPDPQRFGVPVFEGEKIIRIDEKPKAPASNYAVIGIYMYDHRVFDFIKTLKPSERGELEITDVNNFYIREGKIAWDVLEGWWTDAGTFDSLRYAGNMVAETGANKL